MLGSKGRFWNPQRPFSLAAGTGLDAPKLAARNTRRDRL